MPDTPLNPFVVHVAGEPGTDHVQRCVPCGVVLLDNTAWWEGNIAVPTGQDHGPSWWPASSLIATDKVPGTRTASCTYTVESGRPLATDEVTCAAMADAS